MQFAVNVQQPQVREVNRKGKRYLIAPVVALRAGVLNGEYVPAEEVAKHVSAWNGRPVPLGHPTENDEAISANSLDLWDETPAYLWNVETDGNALKGEIWVDIAKAETLGGLAMQAMQRLRNNEQVEVSTGYFRDPEETSGEFDGKPYTSIARNLRPDHLALLLNETGACSWRDGCGTPRTNSAKEQDTGSQSFISAIVRNVVRSLGGKKVDREKLIGGLVANARCKCNREQLETMEDSTLQAFADSMRVNEEMPATAAEPVATPPALPAEIAQFAAAIQQLGGVEVLKAALGAVVTNANSERDTLIAGLVTNHQAGLTKDELSVLPVEALRKLSSALAPRSYFGNAGSLVSNSDEAYVLEMPNPFVKEAK